MTLTVRRNPLSGNHELNGIMIVCVDFVHGIKNQSINYCGLCSNKALPRCFVYPMSYKKIFKVDNLTLSMIKTNKFCTNQQTWAPPYWKCYNCQGHLVNVCLSFDRCSSLLIDGARALSCLRRLAHVCTA